MKNIKTEWNLGLLYKNEKDPQIEKDLQAIEKACAAFEKKYKNKNFISTPESLSKALLDSNTLGEVLNGAKPYFYFALRSELNSSDSVASAWATKIEQRYMRAVNRVAFFELEIAKIPKEKQKLFLGNPVLKEYRYNLKRTFDEARYRLPEGEEQLVNLLSQPAYGSWVSGQRRTLSEKTILYKGEQIPLPKAVGLIADLPLKERRALSKAINESYMSNSQFAEAEINAIYNYKKILDSRRGYAKPYSSSVLNYENEEKEVEALADLVTKHFSISKRFYKLHAKLLGMKKIKNEDRSVKMREIKRKFTFDTTLTIVGDAIGSVDPQYKDILDRYTANGQFDIYPKKGKTGGAFCASQGSLPTFVLLNHVDNIRSVATLGHEMGHAIHGELSRRQPRHYWHYALSTAETASTFFEQVTMDEIEKMLTPEEQTILLHTRIQEDIATIFRQIACFNFERELHERIQKEGEVPRREIAELMRKHLSAYMGSAVDMTHEDGYFFVYWSQIREFFYVYTYAYGQLISRAMFEKWKQDPRYAKKVEQFLSAGRSMSPKDIFKSIGIDTSDPEFFKAGLKGIENDIKRLEKLTAKKQKA